MKCELAHPAKAVTMSLKISFVSLCYKKNKNILVEINILNKSNKNLQHSAFQMQQEIQRIKISVLEFMVLCILHFLVNVL